MIATLRSLLRLAPAPRGRLALAVALGVATIVCGVGLMATAGYLISRAAEQPAILSLTVAIVGVRFFGIARPVFRYLERLASHDLAFRVLSRVRVQVYERIEPLAPARLEAYRRGDLLARLVADVDALQNLHLRGLVPALVALVAGTVAVGATAAFLPAAAVVLAVGLLAGGVVAPALELAAARRASRAQADARGALTAELVEVVSGAPELVVYGREDDSLGRVQTADARLARIARRAAVADGIGDGARTWITGATVAAVLATAVAAHANGRLDRTLVAMLALLALASFEAVQPLGLAARELVETAAAGGRLLELTSGEPAVRDAETPLPAPELPFPLELEDVRVRYPGAPTPALDGFSLRLERGRRLALVGRSGAGKTTVTKLLLRFLDPEAGRVTLAGADLRDYRMEDVRSAIAVAEQDAHLFSTTIRENVRLGREATDAELERAVRAAGLERWVESLPDGLDTHVGEAGMQVSGGQRQRIGVARALLKEPPVLVLDEPTAHLDPPTAEKLLEDVFAATAGQAVLLVTHRPEGLDLVDEVVSIA